MAHAEKCPICYGKGKVPPRDEITTAKYEETCYGCNGKGWVEVTDEQSHYIPPPTEEEILGYKP